MKHTNLTFSRLTFKTQRGFVAFRDTRKALAFYRGGYIHNGTWDERPQQLVGSWYGTYTSEPSDCCFAQQSTIGKVMHDGRNQRLIFDSDFIFHGITATATSTKQLWMRDSDL